MDVIEFRDISLQARMGGKAIDVLRGIEFAIANGGTLGLVGESGAGKSMIGRVVSGLLPANFRVSSGQLRFKGQDLLAMSVRERRALLGRHIAFIPQEPLTALNPVRTIGDQFCEHLAHLGVERGARHALAIAQLRSVRLANAEQIVARYPHELSGGQCQRVLIAMAFSGKPALVVADEPTTALDVLTQAQIMRLIADQQATNGTAMLFITHDLRLAAQVCENVAVMYAGDMVEFGPAADVLGAPTHPYTRSLLASMPKLSGERHMLPALEEHMPGLMAFESMPGCRFASRCGARDSACGAAPIEVGRGHWARCGVTCRTPVVVQARVRVPDPLVPDRDAPPILRFSEVGLRYRGSGGLLGLRKTSFDAVKAATFDVQCGEIIGIVGESGSGKTSVGRLIVGLEKPTSGSIRFDGAAGDATLDDRLYLSRQHAQMIFQDPQSALNPRRSVMRLLTQALEARNDQPSAEDRRQRAQRLAQDVRLPGDCLERFPSQLSGGQKQRVNIGRALCVMPRLIVADEIVSGLDVSVQAHILNLLIELNRREGISIVFISHDLAVVRYLCSRVLLMQQGEIVEQGTTDEVFERPSHSYTRQLLGAVPSETIDGAQPRRAMAAIA